MLTPDLEPPRFRTRTEALFASSAPVAVILRRGPRRHFRLLTWHLTTDRIEAGQWMKGVIQLADLAPDGSKLLYRAFQYHASAARRRGSFGPFDPLKARDVGKRRRPHRRVPRYLRGDSPAGGEPRRLGDSWTAISRPPYFSALAIWPSIGRWTGGGTFEGPSRIRLFETDKGLTPIANAPLPSHFAIGRYERGDEIRFAAHVPSWRADDPRHADIWAALEASGVRHLDWVTGERGSDLLYAADGIICRVRRWRGLALGDCAARAEVVADLRPMAFEPIAPPPLAMRW